jgi:hypothetical protein
MHDVLPSGAAFTVQDDAAFDELVFENKDMEEQCNPMLSSEDVLSLLEDPKKGVKAHDNIASFHDIFLATLHPNLPSNATAEICGTGTSSNFCQTTINIHPFALIIFDIVDGSPEDRLALQGDLDNAVQRHLCQFHCQQKNEAGVCCRFNCPLPTAP